MITVRRDLRADASTSCTTTSGADHDEGYLVYRILDTLTDACYPVIDGARERDRRARGRGARAAAHASS